MTDAEFNLLTAERDDARRQRDDCAAASVADKRTVSELRFQLDVAAKMISSLGEMIASVERSGPGGTCPWCQRWGDHRRSCPAFGQNRTGPAAFSTCAQFEASLPPVEPQTGSEPMPPPTPDGEPS